MFIDFVDVGIVWHSGLSSKIVFIKNVNKHLILDNDFGTDNSGRLDNVL